MNFLDQLQSLRESVPHPSILTVNSENCDYCPYMAGGRNCYLCIGHNMNEDSYYGYWLGFSKDCIDCAFTENSELCYECVDCQNCYDCNFSQELRNCSNCWWSFDCVGCQDCFGCVNLRRKQFYIFNKAYSREEYFKQITKLKQISREDIEVRVLGIRQKEAHNSMRGFQNENVVGDHIRQSKNCFYCFDTTDAEDSAYVSNVFKVKDCYDINYAARGTELCYEVVSGVDLYNSNFCSVCWHSANLEYCDYVFNSKNCFGCVSRNHAEYEILNTPYEPEEYESRVTEIKNQMREQNIYGQHLESVYLS